MMRKKFLAMVTALCVITGTMAAMPIYAEETTTESLPTSKFVVVGINEAGDYVIQEAKHSGLTLYMRQIELDMYTEEETTLSYGDVLLLEGYLSYTELIGTNTFGLFANYNEEPQQDGKIDRIGSVYDEPILETFAVESLDGNDYTASCKFIFDESWFRYYYDFLLEKDYYQPSGIDWSSLRAGDKVTFYTYEGVPMLPTSVAYAGDANADGGVTIADVIFLNRQILGDTGLARTTFNQTLADYDANGIIDAADSLMILKRIVELI